jgi:hypothetical protein
MVEQFLNLVKLDSRNLLPVKYLLIRTIYSIDNNRRFSMEHWLNRIDDIFKNKSDNLSGELYITPKLSRVDKTVISSWCVHLPSFLNPSPRSKYFSIEKYGGQARALQEAVAYRDEVINN